MDEDAVTLGFHVHVQVLASEAQGTPNETSITHPMVKDDIGQKTWLTSFDQRPIRHTRSLLL